MNKRNRLLTAAVAAIAGLGLVSVDVYAQTAGPAPTTSSAFRMYNSSSNWITIAANPANGGTGTFLWPTPSTGILKSDATGTMSIGQITAADLQLTQNSILVGGVGNVATEVAAGSNGQVLRITGGTPTWESINVIPDGGGVGQTLYWDGDSWESTNELNVNPTTGETTIDGDLTVNTGGDVILPNGVINNNELENSSINVTYGTGVSGDASVSLGSTLNLQNTGVTSITGTANQVIASSATGAVTLSAPQDIHTDAIPTFDGIILDNLSGSSTSSEVLVSNGGTVETRTMNILPSGGGVGQTLYWDGDSWESTNELNVNPTTGETTIDGDLTVNTGGDVILPNGVINNNELEYSDVTVNAGTGLSGGGTVALGGSITLNNDGILSIVGTPNQVNVSTTAGVATLSTPQDIHTGASPTFVGMTLTGLNGASTSNDVVVLNGLNQLETRTLNLLPTGTVNHAPLVWDGGTSSWIQNPSVTMDDVSGDIATSGDVSGVNATFTGSDINLTGTPTTAGPLTTENVLIVDPSGNVTETDPNNIVAAATLPENNIYVGNASNNPQAYAPGSDGDVLTVVSGTPTWSTPTGTIAAKGQVTGTGTWSYTVNPGVTLSGSDIIMVTVASTTGLQVTHVVNNISAATFDVEFPVNIGATETFHWMIIQ